MNSRPVVVDVRPDRRGRKRVLALIILGVLGALLILGVRFGWDSVDRHRSAAEDGSVPVQSSAPLVINQTSVVTGLYPGASPQQLSGTFTNSGTAPVYVDAVTAKLSAISGGDGTCTPDSFHLDDPVMGVTADIPVGVGVGEWGGATIRMHNSNQNQDACQLATVHVSYEAR